MEDRLARPANDRLRGREDGEQPNGWKGTRASGDQQTHTTADGHLAARLRVAVPAIGAEQMAPTSNGLTNGGQTTHYQFTYDDSLGGTGGIEPARTNQVIANCEADFNLMSGWFNNI